jgi:quinol monooxygenase YgiN
MKYVLAEYTLKKEAISQALQIVGDFVDAVHDGEPHTINYEAYQKENQVSFVHFIAFEDEHAEHFHHSAPHTKAFVAALYPLCEKKPKFTVLQIV